MVRIGNSVMNVYLIVPILFELILAVHCLVSDWGEPCEFSAECSDHRLICDNKTFVCICDRFHEWKGITIGCQQKYNISSIMKMIVESNNALELLENERDRIFITNIAAGIFVLFMVGVSILAVFGFCICVRRNDRNLNNLVNVIHSKKQQPNLHRRLP